MAEELRLDRAGASRVVAATRHYERHPDYRSTRQTPGRPVPSDEFWIQLTAEGTGTLAGWYSWKLVYFNPVTNAWADVDPAVTGTTNAREQNQSSGLYSAATNLPQRYRARTHGYNASGDPVYLFAGTGQIFPVKVTKTGGAGGSKTTAASWTYTVSTIGDIEIGTAVAVGRPRPLGAMAFGTGYGLAFYNQTGALVLWDAGETPGSGGC
ncbi:MAG TPA: hypothetical protein VGN72_07555 [Tepidisphaeraceae bacterium]|jgi:hypothetical protein|nr:hypothetical protein [Tepidisphaeraceae bacterium]